MKRHGGFGDKALLMSSWIFTGRGERKGSETFEVTRTENLAHDKKKQSTISRNPACQCLTLHFLSKKMDLRTLIHTYLPPSSFTIAFGYFKSTFF